MTKKILIIILLLFFSAAYSVNADNLTLDSFELQTSEGQNVKSIAEDILKGEWKWDINDIISKALGLLFSSLKNNISLISMMIIVSLVSSVLLNLKNTFSSEMADVGFYAAYIIVAVLGAKGVGIAIEYGTELTRQLDVYVKTIIPVVLSVSMASGAVISGAVVQPLIIGISQAIAFVVTQWLIPVLSVICAMSVVNNLNGKGDLSGIIMLLQKTVRWTCGILMTGFVGIMTVQCMITPALDSVAGKMTRYAIANFVPVVGGLISESVSVVAGYASALKGALGGAGIITAVVVCIKPLSEIASIAILYNITSAVLRPVCDKRIFGLLGSFGQIVSSLLIMVIMMMLMFVINVTSAVNISGLGSVIQ